MYVLNLLLEQVCSCSLLEPLCSSVTWVFSLSDRGKFGAKIAVTLALNQSLGLEQG